MRMHANMRPFAGWLYVHEHRCIVVTLLASWSPDCAVLDTELCEKRQGAPYTSVRYIMLCLLIWSLASYSFHMCNAFVMVF